MNASGNYVSIITVNFNQPAVTEAMLASVFLYNKYPHTEIIVIDNGSRMNPVPEWKLKYPSVQFIRSEINTGFAGGNNIGIRQAKGEYLFLVNNDTEFTEGLVSQLVETLDNYPQTGMVSPKIRYYQQPDTLQYTGYTNMNFFTARNNCIGQFEKDKGQYDAATGITGYAHGAAMMVRKEAISKAGLMRENYFLYYEEMDWCERIKRQGYDIRVNMQALIYHKESVSVGRNSALKEYFMNRNRILFIRRNAHWYQKWVFYFYFIMVVTPRNILTYIKDGEWAFIPLLFRAIWWNITHKTTSNKLGFKRY
jgi:GT2 family glycosyltransferase